MTGVDNLTLVALQILNCRRCGLRAGCRSPVPPQTPSVPSPYPRILVLGEAPGSTEDRTNSPFVGPAGQLFRSLMSKVGLNPDSLYWANTVACYPNRTPTEDEVDKCSRNKLDTISAIEPAVIILAGSVALKSFRPDLKITQMQGRPLHVGKGEGFYGRIQHWADPLIFWPVIHPAACLNGRTPTLRGDLEASLYELVFRLRGGKDGFMLTWPEDCWTCYRPADHYDEMGVGHCDIHWQKQLRLL